MSSLEVAVAEASQPPSSQPHTRRHPFLLLTNAALLVLGTAGPLLLRVYFLHGGTHLWLSTLVQVCGWPIVLVPLSFSYLLRRRTLGQRDARLILLTPRLAAASAALGALIGLNSYMYAYGSSYLPLSTSALLVSTQLAFTAVFALLIVRHLFTAYSVNSVVLLTLGPVVLGMGSGGERPKGETSGRYYLGFGMMVGAAAIIGAILPLTELMYRKAKQRVTYALVMETQLVMGVFGTGLCLVGMAANKEFQGIQKEASEFGLGKVKYYMVLFIGVFFWQAINLGLVGLIYAGSSLFAGILIAVLLPSTELLAVIFLHEKFTGSKGVALVLCLWGLASYFYGEKKQSKKLKKTTEMELPQPIP